MFRRFFTLFLLVALPLIGGEVQVTTWNILADSYLREEYYPSHDITQLTWEHRRESLLKKIGSFNSDIVMLQEVEPTVYQEMQEFLSAFGYEGVYAKKRNGRPEGSAIFYRSSFGRFLGFSQLYYDDCQKGTPSGNTALFLFFQVEGRVLGVATSHITFARNPKAEMAGVFQVQQLLLEMKRYPEVDSWIVGGDFNGEIETPKVRQMVAAGFQDAYTESPKPTFGFPHPVRIDFLFHSSTLSPKPIPEPFDWSGPALPTKEIPSDHLPVTVRFSTL